MSKVLTMVMRSGEKNAPANSLNYLLVSEDYNFLNLTGSELLRAIQRGEFSVTNIGVKNGSLVGTNGDISKYAFFNIQTNALDGMPSPVVLNRIEVDGELHGYTIINTNGMLEEVTIVEALKIHATTPFANGKIRHTNDGDIIQSINGNYLIRRVDIPKESGHIEVDVAIFGSILGTKLNYVGLVISADNVAGLTRVHDMLAKDNQDVVNKIKGVIKDKNEIANFHPRRTGTTGFYTVITLDSAIKLIKKSHKVRSALGKLIVACTDYKSGEESSVFISNDYTVEEYNKGTSETEGCLQRYVKDLIPKIKELKLSNWR